MPIEDDAAMELARRSRGTPRICNRLFKRVRDFALVEGSDTITLDIMTKSLDRLKVDAVGLDDTDYKIVLKSLAHPSMNQVKLISNLTGQNFIVSKRLLENGGVLLSAKAIEIREKKKLLNENGVNFSISPEFPY